MFWHLLYSYYFLEAEFREYEVQKEYEGTQTIKLAELLVFIQGKESERLVGEVLYGFPDIYMINSIPLLAIVFMAVVVGVLSLFGGKIYM